MKRSQRVSLIASFAYVIIATILILLVKPSLGWTLGAVPGMVYVLMAASLLCPIVCYIIVPRVEKMEEDEQKAEKGKEE